MALHPCLFAWIFAGAAFIVVVIQSRIIAMQERSIREATRVVTATLELLKAEEQK